MSPLFNQRFRQICMIAGMVLLLPAGILAQSKKPQAAQMADNTSPQGTLDLAMYYYNNDDLEDDAKELFKRLLTPRYKNTPQSETAQYYLAAYYQRRFYLCREKRGDPDWSALRDAVVQYRKYTDNYYGGEKHKWLNESFFNLAMVYLQLGEPWNAVNELSKMRKAAEIDPAVYIYQIVWSSQSQDVIDSDLPAAQLADYAKKVVQENGNNFDKAVLLIQKWCQGQRVKSYKSASN
jgi:hypothetical protein